jgi:hypothetical protein
MDRNIVYPGAIPLDTDNLSPQRSAMVALGFMIQAALGTNTVVDGLACTQTTVASMSVQVGPGSITSLTTVDATAFGSLSADTTDPLVKMGVNLTTTALAVTAPTTSGQSINYLVEASFQESDATPVVLPYYNSSNPSVAYSGPANAGTTQNTQRLQRVNLAIKAGTAATTGTQTAPAADSGCVGLYVVTVAYGATSVTNSNISVLATAPFLAFKLPSLRPGFASGIQAYNSHGSYTFTVPAGVTQIEAEAWGAGSGSWAAVSGVAGGGGSGGGYAKKRITGLTPGSTISVTVGQGGSAGTSGVAPTAGGSTTLGAYCSATGGQVNGTTTVSFPAAGNIGGVGSGGDLNLWGGDGGAGQSNQTVGGNTVVLNQGGYGGEGALTGGAVNSGGVGNAGRFPGGGASGAGTGASGTTAANGAAGADGCVIIRW